MPPIFPLTISILCYNVSNISKQCFGYILENTYDLNSIQFILTNNGSTDDTKEILDSIEFPNKLVIHNSTNTGFIKANNVALTHAVGKYFLVMNDDLYIFEKDWDKKLLEYLDTHQDYIVGLKGTNCTFTDDGCGFIGDRIDYIEGSFLVGRTDLFRTYGLFSEDLAMYECEDSDLSLRYRQMGYELGHFDMDYKHLGHKTIDHVDQQLKWSFCGNNRIIFRNRWMNYIKSKVFYNKILASVSSLGIGDVICALPAIEALRTTHPTALIDVESRFSDIFLNNPKINQHFNYGSVDISQYDRVVRLEPDFSLEEPLHKLFDKIAHVTPKDSTPNLVLSDNEKLIGKTITKVDDRKVIVCSLLMSRREWQGRNWNLDHATEFIKLLKSKFSEEYRIIEVGKNIPSTNQSDVDLVDRTDLRQLFSVIYHCDIFIGIDSLPFHVAQAFRKNCIVLFGATRPYTRVIDSSLVTPVTNEGLSCIGCYHDKKQSVFNKCDRGDELCMTGITPQIVIDKLNQLLNIKEV